MFVCLFVCLFVWSLTSHSRIFHSYGGVTITGGLQILTCARHSWPLSSECSLACHTYCETRHPSPRTRDIYTCCRAFDRKLSLPVLTTWVCVGFDHPTFHMRGESSDWPHQRGCYTNLQRSLATETFSFWSSRIAQFDFILTNQFVWFFTFYLLRNRNTT